MREVCIGIRVLPYISYESENYATQTHRELDEPCR